MIMMKPSTDATPPRRFAPSLVRSASAPSTRRWIVLLLLYSGAGFAALLALVAAADALFDFLHVEVSVARRLAGLGWLSTWGLVYLWVGRQVYEGKRKGYRYGLVLFVALLLSDVLLRDRSVFDIIVSVLSIAALVSIRDELTN